MTSLNIHLPRRLKEFAEKQAAAKGLPGASEYVQTLLTAEERKRSAISDLEAKLQAGLDSGKPIPVDEAYWANKRTKLLPRPRKKGAR